MWLRRTYESEKSPCEVYELIKKYTGENAKVVRAPGGAVNDNVKAAVKYPLVNWSVDTLDWKTRDKASTVSAIKNNVRDIDIKQLQKKLEKRLSHCKKK